MKRYVQSVLFVAALPVLLLGVAVIFPIAFWIGYLIER